MKKIVCIMILIVIICAPAYAHADIADELNDNIDEGLNNIDFSEVNDVASDFLGDVAQKVRSIINGEFDDVNSFWEIVGSLFGEGVRGLLPQLISVFVVLVILGLIRKSSGGLISDSTDSVVSFVGVTVVLASILSMIVEVYKQIFSMLNRVATLSEVSSPILLTLLVANLAARTDTPSIVAADIPCTVVTAEKSINNTPSSQLAALVKKADALLTRTLEEILLTAVNTRAKTDIGKTTDLMNSITMAENITIDG